MGRKNPSRKRVQASKKATISVRSHSRDGKQIKAYKRKRPNPKGSLRKQRHVDREISDAEIDEELKHYGYKEW